MVVDVFGALLQELGNILGVELHSDKNNSCLIKLKEGISVQLEVDKKGEFLVIGTDLGNVPPGKYRENLFREALRANGQPSPNYGIFSYSKQSERMVLFARLSLRNLTGEKISTYLTPFVLKAKLWKDAIEKGDVPVIQTFGPSTAKSSSGIFGLMR